MSAAQEAASFTSSRLALTFTNTPTVPPGMLVSLLQPHRLHPIMSQSSAPERPVGIDKLPTLTPAETLILRASMPHPPPRSTSSFPVLMVIMHWHYLRASAAQTPELHRSSPRSSSLAYRDQCMIV